MKVLLIFSLIAICFARKPFPDQTDDKFQKECLQSHNQFRAKHHSPPLKLDYKLVKYAKSRCSLISQSKRLKHGHAGLAYGYGENLYWSGWSINVVSSGFEGVKDWYDEVKDYDFKKPGYSDKTGHFTQIVWKSTKKVGCARCGGKGSKWYETYVVCDYSPSGNIVGDNNIYFEQNVSKE